MEISMIVKPLKYINVFILKQKKKLLQVFNVIFLVRIFGFFENCQFNDSLIYFFKKRIEYPIYIQKAKIIFIAKFL